MRIGTLTQRLGTTTHAVRFYERHGLLPAPERTENGYREYSEADAERLRLLRATPARPLAQPGRPARRARCSLTSAPICDGASPRCATWTGISLISKATSRRGSHPDRSSPSERRIGMIGRCDDCCCDKHCCGCGK